MKGSECPNAAVTGVSEPGTGGTPDLVMRDKMTYDVNSLLHVSVAVTILLLSHTTWSIQRGINSFDKKRRTNIIYSAYNNGEPLLKFH